MTLATLPSAARPISRLLLIAASLAPLAHAQTPAAALPAGTPLVLETPGNLPMRAGLPFTAELLYPVYADNHIVVPERTIVHGAIVSLRPDTPRRTRARLGGDFTPFHIPIVHFTELVLPDGAHVPIQTGPSTNGAPIFRAVAPPKPKGGFVRQQFDAGLTVVRTNIALFTAPGKADRATQFLYGRLPYHPERIEKTTAWTTKTEADIALPAQPAAAPLAAAPPPRAPHWWQEPTPEVPPSDQDTGHWTVQAYLNQALSSETSRTGQPISATVAVPILNPDGTVAIPQGATLVGTIAKAQPARRFGRSGTLSFNFRQLTLPQSGSQNVETTLTGADSVQGFVLNSEGQVKSRPRDRISVPVILALLASRPLDHDRDSGGTGGGQGRNAVAGAAGLGLVGTIISLSGSSPNTAAGIGYYGTALSLYDRWVARGKKVNFPENTRIVVQTISRRSAPMHADPARSTPPPPQ